jgi:hypothetical protein
VSGTASADAPAEKGDRTVPSSLGRFVDLPDVGSLEGLNPTLQDVVTVEEYERLTGVHKRLGFGPLAMGGILGGGTAGKGLILGRLLDVTYTDIWDPVGFGGGLDFSIMVMPLYTVNFGVGIFYRTGDSSGGNTWTDLQALPFYLGLRVNLPWGVSMDRWLDFENPDIAYGKLFLPIPFIKIQAVGFFMNEVRVDGWAVEPGKASVGGDEEFFRRGIYGGFYGGGGFELRFENIGIVMEIGMRYIWHPKLTLRFDELLTNGDFFDIQTQASIVYYFGSGRLIKVGM